MEGAYPNRGGEGTITLSEVDGHFSIELNSGRQAGVVTDLASLIVLRDNLSIFIESHK
jgi:hypothetical protein